jgi:hypothetical protein
MRNVILNPFTAQQGQSSKPRIDVSPKEWRQDGRMPFTTCRSCQMSSPISVEPAAVAQVPFLVGNDDLG